MEDFIVNRQDSEDGKCYFHIVYYDVRRDEDKMVNCFGAAFIRPEDESEYCFNYSFYHTLDWRQVSEMTLQPLKSYKLSMEQVRKIACDIFFNIKEFVCKMN